MPQRRKQVRHISGLPQRGRKRHAMLLVKASWASFASFQECQILGTCGVPRAQGGAEHGTLALTTACANC